MQNPPLVHVIPNEAQRSEEPPSQNYNPFPYKFTPFFTQMLDIYFFIH